MNYLADFETNLLKSFQTAAGGFGSELLTYFTPAFVAGFAIWITLIGYEVAMGKSEDGFTYIFTKIGKIFLIGIIALKGWPEIQELLGLVKEGFVTTGSFGALLETAILNPLLEIGTRIYLSFTTAMEGISWTDSSIGTFFMLSPALGIQLLAYLVVIIAVMLFSAVSMAMYLVSTCIYIMLMAIGPFFLLCLAFPFLQRYFETFIGAVMTTILGMAFSVLLLNMVTTVFEFNNLNAAYPIAQNPEQFIEHAKNYSALLVSKALQCVLLIYMYFKVFDLASTLGGGMNMGNNLVGGVRAIMRDLGAQMAAGSGKGGKSGNSMSEGSGGASGGSASAAASGRAQHANSTFTGAAIGAGASAAIGVGRGGARLAKGTARAAAYVGRYAYNRFAQQRNQIAPE